MKVLVTGGAGYLGSVVTHHLLKQRHVVRVLDSLLHGGSTLPLVTDDPSFEFVQGDVRSADTVNKALDGMDAVVHLAAIVGDPACGQQPALARKVNQDASLQLVESSRLHGIERFIFASTCSNYGRIADPSQYVTEESDLRPVSLYAETKVAVEEALLQTPSGKNTTATILRFATLFGLSPRMRFDLTVNEFTMELVTKRILVVYGEQFWRPYVHVRDAARAIALVLTASTKQVGGQVYNVGDTGENYQKGQLVELIRTKIDGEVEIEHVDKAEDPRDYRVSFEKIKRELGFHITRTVEDGILEIISAIRDGIIADCDNPRYRNAAVS